MDSVKRTYYIKVVEYEDGSERHYISDHPLFGLGTVVIDTPRLMVKTIIETKKFVAGYCPTCGGIVHFKNTFVRKHRGACCTWCGQALDWEGRKK